MGFAMRCAVDGHRALFCLLLALPLVLFTSCATLPQQDGLQQAIVVTTTDWTAVQGRAQRYERASGHPWQKVGESFQVVVGKTGLAWGAGLKSTSGLDGPVKHEGDGKAPAGVFALGAAFGYGRSADTKLSYLQLTDTVECVDDADSPHYNRLLDSASVTPRDWNSSEHMHRPDELYRLGIFVDHNADPPVAGRGSCIFLHIWRGSDQGTVGCTAMEPANIAMLLAWLDPKRHPVLIQMPIAQYDQQKTVWDLPSL